MNEAEASCILTFDHARNAGRCFPSFFASPKKNPMIAITYSFYPAKTVIVKQDTPANIVYLIEHGLVKLVRENSKSNEVIIGFRHRDWLIGAPTILLGKPYNFTIIAVVPTRLREIPKKDFQELIKKDEQLSQHGQRALSQQIFDLMKWVEAVKYLSAKNRLVLFLADKRTYLSPISKVVEKDYSGCSSMSATSALDVLSPREREVLQLLAEGQSTREIAATLKVGMKTVETYRLKITEKLDLHTIAELTKFAVREGLTSL